MKRSEADSMLAGIGRRLLTALCLVGGALFSIGGDASAESGSAEDPRFLRYVTSDALIPRLYVAAIMTDAYLNRWCNDESSEYRIGFEGVSGPHGQFVKQDNAEHPSQGTWIVRYGVEFCGDKRSYNALFDARPNRPPVMHRWYPGTTDVDPLLGRDLLAPITTQALRARGEKTTCKDARVFDTNLTAPKTRQADGTEAWVEVWAVNACGLVFRIPVAFTQTPEKPGTAYKLMGAKLDKDAVVPQPLAGFMADMLAKQAIAAQRKSGDQAKAVRQIEKAAKGNGPFAQYVLAVYHMEGRGVPRSNSGMAYWALRSAHNGFVRAMHLVGAMYSQGIFFERDYELAAAWFQKTADAGESRGAQDLKKLIDSGLVDPETLRETGRAKARTDDGSTRSAPQNDDLR